MNMYMRTVVCMIYLCKFLNAQNCSDQRCVLMKTLLDSYEIDARPICGQQSTIEVVVELALRQIVDLDEPRQILKSNLWIRLDWSDCKLKWDPAKYRGTDIVHLPYDRIWTPDLTLYDDSAFGSNVAMSERKFHRLSVTSEGRVSQRFPTVVSSICGVDATYFPFDEQQCPLKFGLWVYDDSRVNLTSDLSGDTSSYVENAEWSLVSVKGDKSPHMIKNKTFTAIVYTINMDRRPTFFMLTLFFPCFLISTMAIIGFLLPPSSDKKLDLQLTLLLSLTVFEFLTLGLMPPNSKPLPLMCVYFALVMILASLSCMLSVVVLKVYLKGKQGWKVSDTVKKFLIDKVGKVLKVKRPHILRQHAENDLHKTTANGSINERLPTISVLNDEETNSELRAVLKCFQKISVRLGDLLKHMEGKKKVRDSVEYQDWLTIAAILDRIFLILYVLLSVTVFMTFGIKLAS